MTPPQTTPRELQVADELTAFVRERFLDGDQDTLLTTATPLLEWGVLTSMNTMLLLTHIRETYGVEVPPTAITAHHLRDTRRIAALVCELADSAG